jgi:hypothetical protein
MELVGEWSIERSCPIQNHLVSQWRGDVIFDQGCRGCPRQFCDTEGVVDKFLIIRPHRLVLPLIAYLSMSPTAIADQKEYENASQQNFHLRSYFAFGFCREKLFVAK